MAMFGLPGGSEWIFILVIVLVLFGPTQIPKLAKMLGKSKKALEDGLKDPGDDDEDKAGSETGKAATKQSAEDKDADEE